MEEFNISDEMVLKTLRKLKISKSSGPDGLHPRFLRELASSLCIPIAIIFRTSLETMEVPVEWKQARISAIFKKGSKKLASNYRPVSLTSIVCKSMEHIIRDKLVSHMKANKAFSPKQYGFISGRSTCLQLLKVIDQWTEAIDDGKTVDTIYLDFMKAFDTVPHRRLIGKLRSYDVTDPILSWIKSFLTGRVPQVSINGAQSEWMNVTSGIPQGSVLGPVLFVIYLNDLPECVISEAYLFADDTKLYRIIYEQNDHCILQSDLDKLQDWSDIWLLRFHPDKCKAMTIGNPSEEEFKYSMKSGTERQILIRTTEEKDIGVTIDSKLEFEKHINEKINKANSIFSLIRRSYMFLDSETFLPLYRSLVRSHLDYAQSVWSPYKQKYIEALENVQRRATQQLPGFKELPYKQRLEQLKLPTLTYRRLRGDMIEVYKILHEKYDPEAASFLKLRKDCASRSGLRGHDLKLFQQRAKKNLRKNTFSLRIVSTWNKLPKEVVEAPSVNSFKNRLDKFWSKEDMLYNYKAPYTGGDATLIPEEEDEELTIEA